MNRNTVIVDGTKPGSAPCSAAAATRTSGPGSDGSDSGSTGSWSGRPTTSGWRTSPSATSSAAPASAGNEIWWNGGDGSGKIGGHGINGAYLTATSTFFDGRGDRGRSTGSSRATGAAAPGTRRYASNFNDSGYYIGACQQVCNQTIEPRVGAVQRARLLGHELRRPARDRELGVRPQQGRLRHQQPEQRRLPSPQDGACPNGGTSPITHTHSCWVFMHNYVHDNNNPNVPAAGAAAAGPAGTGMSVSGGRDDTIMDNRFENNGAWGMIFVPYPDTETPPHGASTARAARRPGRRLHLRRLGQRDRSTTRSRTTASSATTPTATSLESTTTAGRRPTASRQHGHGGGTLTSSPSGLQQSNADLRADRVGARSEQLVHRAGGLRRADSSQRVSARHELSARTDVVMHPLPARLPRACPTRARACRPNPWCSGQVATCPQRWPVQRPVRHGQAVAGQAARRSARSR